MEVLQLEIDTLACCSVSGCALLSEVSFRRVEHLLPLPTLQQEHPCNPTNSQPTFLRRFLELYNPVRTVTKLRGAVPVPAHTLSHQTLDVIQTSQSLLKGMAAVCGCVPLLLGY